MLFNSIDFALFLPVVFLLYWFVFNTNLRAQNLLIVVASYFFYACWDWRFLFLIFFSTLVDYFVGIGFLKTDDSIKRKFLLCLSLIVNLGVLALFKYYDFFIANVKHVFCFFGNSIQLGMLNVILPVGISFYTFQTLSYSIDVYKKRIEPTNDFISFAAFVSFFPQLVAGPIERANHFLPQFFVKRKFNYSTAVDGLRQILWGLFKKVVIADGCAQFANLIFNNSENYSGSTLVLGALFFAFQIYGDFSGYSDIAIGVSRLFGFKLMQNFKFPYFSRDIAEFWRCWHISLSTWFRDYLYIPLGGSRKGTFITVRNVFIIFIVSGFWHGANWTFIIWGIIHAVYLIPYMLTKNNRNNLSVVSNDKVLPSFKDFLLIVSTFSLTVFAWIFFRAKNVEHAINYVKSMFSKSLFTVPEFENKRDALLIMVFVLFMILIEWIGRREQYALAVFWVKKNKFSRLLFYFLLSLIVLLFSGTKQEFIYFQF